MNHHLEYYVLGTGAKYLFDNDQQPKVVMMPEKHDDIVKNIFRFNPFIHSTVMMRKEFLQKMDGYVLSTGYKNIEDWDLWIRGHKLFKYYNLQKSLIRYKARYTMTWPELLNRFRGAIKLLINNNRIVRDGWYIIAWFISALLSKTNLYKPKKLRTN